MKFAVVFVVLALATAASAQGVSPEALQQAAENMKVCSQQTGISEDQLNKLKTGDFSGVDEKSMCFVQCFMEKSGILSNSGDFLVDKAFERAKTSGLNVEKLTAIFEKCKNEKGSGKCETPFKMFKCAFDNRAQLL
ncbi:hypothetical protein DMENIID0001_144150 [Sergentomyia squamirostris]